MQASIRRREDPPRQLTARQVGTIVIVLGVDLILALFSYLWEWRDVAVGQGRVEAGELFALVQLAWIPVVAIVFLRLWRHYRALRSTYESAVAELHRRVVAEDDLQRRRRETVDKITRVIAHRDLRILFQPIVALDSGEVVGVEALSRFNGEERAPNEWFSDAAGVGLGLQLEIIAIEQALQHRQALPDGAYLALNASPETLASASFLALLLEPGVPSDRIVVELTEHAVVENYNRVEDALLKLRKLGIRLAVDDVGAGHSTLAHIRRLHPEIIKLDREFSVGLERNGIQRTLITSLVGFCRDAGATLVAEGIEDRDQLETLRALGVKAAQGFYLCAPSPLPLPPLKYEPWSPRATAARGLR